MKRFVLKIYDFLSSRKWLAAVILAVTVVLCVLLASRIDYEEDISSFLPQDEESARYADIYGRLGGLDKIAVFFRIADGSDGDRDLVVEAMDAFADNWQQIDTAGIVQDISAILEEADIPGVMEYLLGNIPYFLTEADYARMDSLLSQEGYVASRLEADKASLYYSPVSAMGRTYLRYDPLGLYSPVLQRLSGLNPTEGNNLEDGHLFTGDGSIGVILFNSPFGSSETARNADLAGVLENVTDRTMIDFPGVVITSTGGPLVAVANSERIKKDSLFAALLAVVLICLVLWLSFKRISDVFWMVISILCGAIFSIAVISLFKSSISLIVLGIGSMIFGIAANYPLHFVDHLKFRKDKRRALADQITPLVIGNITTVGAFLSLLLLKADALHDFGLVGAATLIGTIVFVLAFLPVFVPDARKERRTLHLDIDRFIHPSSAQRSVAFGVFLILTIVFAIFGQKIEFDADMHHINYMTDSQSEGFEILSDMAGSCDDVGTVYAVAEAGSAQEALEAGQMLSGKIRKYIAANDSSSLSTICDFLPSASEQARKLKLWNSFLARNGGLAAEVTGEASRLDFAASAFDPFFNTLQKDFQVEGPEFFDKVTSTFGKEMYLEDEISGKVSIVSYLKLPSGRIADAKAELRQDLPESTFLFDADDTSGRLVGLLSDDFDRIGLICSVIVFLFLWISFAGIELAVVTFLPLAVGWMWILGIMQLTGLQFNIVNIILATFIFGQGDDYSIFITEGLMYEYACGKKILTSYKNCVILSALLMFIGIGSLIFAGHPAMRSLAQVTMIGMLTVVLMAYYLPPLAFRFLTVKSGRKRQAPLTLVRLLNTFLTVIVFLLAMLFTLVFTLLYVPLPPFRKKKYIFHCYIRMLAVLSLKFIPGIRYTLVNEVGEDFSKPAVYVCNHQSHLDLLPLLALNPKIVVLTKKWVWRNPLYGLAIRYADYLPVDNGYDANLPKFRSLAEQGYSILIFPEGTRSQDCTIQRFQRGAFTLAKDLGIDILPLFLHGSGYAMPKMDFVLRKADISLEVGRRVSADSLCGPLSAVAKEFRQLYVTEYERIRDERETASYVAPLVRYQYLYKGADARAECRKYLRPSALVSMDDRLAPGTSVRILNSGCGVYSLLYALCHRHNQIYAYEKDEERFLIASLCTAVPSNLHYVHWTEDVAPAEIGKEIVL